MASPAALSSALATALPHSTGPAASTPPRTGKTTPLRMRHPDYTQTDNPLESESDDNAYDSDGETTAVDDLADDNYVRKVLAKERPLPPITLKNLYKEINVISTLALTIVPALAFYGALNVEVRWQTMVWCVL